MSPIFRSKIKMYATHTKKFMTRHAKYAWVLTLVAVLVVLGVYFKKEFIGAVGYSFVQNNWGGGITANLATHTSNQSGWSEITSSSNLSGINSLSLGGEFFRDDFATSTTAVNPVLGGGFSAGTFTDTLSHDGRVKLAPSTTVAPKVFSGNHGRSAYVLKPDGTVWAWGYNNTKQLGDSTTTDKHTPILVPISDVRDLAIHGYSSFSGTYTVVAVKNDGTVWEWGDGQFCCGGSGAGVSQIAGLSDIVDVAVGDMGAFALKSDGTLYSWGSNNFGTRGDGTTAGGQNSSTITQVHGVGDVGFLTDVVDVATGGFRGYALKSDGSVYVWGCIAFLIDCTGHRVPEQILGLSDVVAINAVGNGDGNFGNKFYALKADGTVWTDTYANSQFYATQTIEQVTGLSNIAEVSSGTNFVMARDHNRNVWTWGTNTYGQLGDGTDTSSSGSITTGTFTQVPGLSSIVSVASGWETAYALRDDGTVYSWGRNQYGQIGDNTTTDRWSPVEVQKLNFFETSLTSTNPVVGGNILSQAIMPDGTLWSWGSGSSGQFGNGTILNSPTPVQFGSLTDVIAIARGLNSTYALTSGGNMWSAGDNGSGQLGIGAPSGMMTTPQLSGFLDNVIAIAAGESFGIALKGDNTVWVWGWNPIGDTTGVPFQVADPLDGSGFLQNVIAIAAGPNSAYVLKGDNTVWAWGANGLGQLGDGTTVDRINPVQVVDPGDGSGFLQGVAQISASYGTTAYDFVLIRKNDNTVWSWGNNYWGQLGNGSTVDSQVPVQVEDPLDGSGFLQGIVDIGLGYWSGYALKSDGTVWAWGRGDNGELGDGNGTGSTTPVQVSGLSNIDALGDMGFGHALARASDGGLWAWGNNTYGELGNNNTINQFTPVRVFGSTTSVFDAEVTSYPLTGTFESAIIDFGAPTEFTTFDYRKFPNEANYSPYMSARVGNVAVPDGSWTDWSDPLDTGSNIGFLSGKQYFQYKAEFNNEFTADLLDVSVGYRTVYPTSGDLTSSVYDTEDATNRITSLAWTGTGTSTTEIIKFQVRTSADNSTWTNWCGMADDINLDAMCTGTNYFMDTDNGVTLPATNPLAQGGNDRYIQYKVFMEGDGTATPTLTNISVAYAFNDPPEFDPGYESGAGVSASQSGDGSVSISYSLRDADTAYGATTPGFITPSFEYFDGSSWNSIPSGDLTAPSIANQSVDGVSYSVRSATWNASTTAPNLNISNAQIRVTANDNEVAHNTTTATTVDFALDTDPPAVSALNAPVGLRTPTSAGITFTTDELSVGYVEYSTQIAGDYATLSSASPLGTSHTITLSGLPTDTVYSYRAYAVDQFGNTSALEYGGTFTLGTPSLLSFTDDGATSTTSTLNVAGGDFDLGVNSSIQVIGSGIGASLNLASTGGAYTPKIVAAGGSSYAIKDDGTLWAWGNNTYGQLGDGTTNATSTPVQITALSNVTDVVAGGADGFVGNGYGTAYALSGGHVYAWGSNSHGQLGQGDYTDSLVPVQVPGLTNITQIAAGFSTAYALKNDGTVYAWGDNSNGALGTGSSDPDSTVPVTVSIPGAGSVVSLAGGIWSGFALKSNGDVYAWGWNDLGLLGDGGGPSSNVPVQSLVSNITEISATGAHVFVLDTSNHLWAWGYNIFGEIGTGVAAGMVSTPTDVLSGVAHAYAGFVHSLALMSNGDVYAWGSNQTGEIGAFSNPSPTPALLSDFTNVSSLSGGVFYSLAFHTDGAVTGIGGNAAGQLGDGTTNDTNGGTPVQVGGPAFNLGGSVSYAPSGTFTSNVIDLAQEAQFTILTYSVTLNGEVITVDARAGNTATPDGTWTPWQTNISSGGDISGLEDNRYFQYRVHFSTSDTGVTPQFNQLTVFYTQYTTDSGPTPTPTSGGSGSFGGNSTPPPPAPVVPPVVVPPTPPVNQPTTTEPITTETTPVAEIPPEVIPTLPPFFQETIQERADAEAAEYASEHPVDAFFNNLFGGDERGSRASYTESPSVVEFFTAPLVKGFDTLTNLPGLKETFEVTRDIVETPLGDITTKAIATAGVATGLGLALSSLFLNPLALSEIFLVPLRLAGVLFPAYSMKRRARRWGTVYDSVTKQPLDPAYVVVYDQSGKEVATSITDLDGRYGFLLPPGTYTIKAHKTNYTFPSTKLTGRVRDELYDDLYFGEPFTIGVADALLTKNIPLDPETFDWNEFVKKDKSLMAFHSQRDLTVSKVATILFWVGAPLTAVITFITPAPYNSIIAGLYGTLLLARVLGLKPKAHGQLKDKNNNPLSYAIVRVYNIDLGNKEIFHRVADALGRYYCLVQKGRYYITVEQKNPDETYTLVYTSPSITTEKGVIREEVKIV